MAVIKESGSTGNFWGLLQMLEGLSDDCEVKDVQMILGRVLLLKKHLSIRTVCPLLFGVRYFLQRSMRLIFCDWWGLFHLEVILRSVSNLILDLIHSEIFIIDLIPLFCNLYFLQVFLDPLENTIIMMVSPIIMMMMLRVSTVRNTGISWALEMMRLNVKRTNLSQCPPLLVGPHSFSSLLISDNMVARALARGFF